MSALTFRAVIHQDSLAGPTAVVDFLIREALSTPFYGQVTFASEDPDLAIEDLLWTEAQLELCLVQDDRVVRTFGGVIEQASYSGMDREGQTHLYTVVLRPRIHGLKYRIRSRIFQNKSLLHVARECLVDAGIPEDTLFWEVLDRPVLEYTTQWQESELDFVSRLLEEAGVFYWFNHDAAGHTMVITDTNDTVQPADESTVFGVALERQPGEPAALWDVEMTSDTTFDAVVLREWNWQTPQIVPQGVAEVADGRGFERYEHEGGFENNDEGTGTARIRLDEQMCRRRVLSGRTFHPGLTVGRHFTLDCERAPDFSLDYIILESEQRFGVGGDGVLHFEASFAAIPRDVPIRAPRRTPRPRVYGKESAVITGPAGEEIHTDENGRCKVHFYWDREGEVDDTATRWIRVQQLNTQMTLVLPRVGWEVDVGFLYGDPDRPIVLHKLYNEETLPPYELPANLMQSSLQSASSPGGGGTNELRMNDGAGGQELFMHAQKDFDCTAGRNMSEDVAVDATTQVGTTYGEAVGGNETISIGGNQAWSVEGGATLDTAAGKTVTVGGSDTWGVKAIYSNTVDGSRTDSVGGLKNVLAQKASETFNTTCDLTVGGVYSINAGGPIAEATAGSKDETVGGAKLEICTGSKGENVGVAKVLNCGLAKFKTGASFSMTAVGALAINTGGPLSIKCGGDFTIAGSSVTMNLGQAKLQSGGARSRQTRAPSRSRGRRSVGKP